MNVETASAPSLAESLPRPTTRKPRLGFAGVGWIGRNRMEAIADSALAEIAAIADPATDIRIECTKRLPDAEWLDSFEQLLQLDLDGIVIATPSALHAEQVIAALENGCAVFCQKPLGLNFDEAEKIILAARAANRLLGVDLSYRFLSSVQKIHEIVRRGELGDIFCGDLIFHNAYGPDKAWFYNRTLSGGGCVIDLGVHLVDLALWMLNFPDVARVNSRLLAQGKPLTRTNSTTEDFATAQIELANGTILRLTCSWKLPAGCDAIIQAAFYGTKGGVALKNIDGSFYQFAAERYSGTKREVLNSPEQNWGGLAAIDWARRLARGEGYNTSIKEYLAVASTLDAIQQSHFS